MSSKYMRAFTALAFGTVGLCLAAGLIKASEPVMPQSEDQAWSKSYDPATKRRFIPVELWTGAPWSGKHEIVMGTADLKFGNYDRATKNKHIRGPKQWRHNVTNKQFGIYDRQSKGRRGSTKLQYFTVRDDKQALGRIYDSRRRYAYLSPGAKFPLGYWTQGETRTFKATLLRNAYKKTGGTPLTDLGPIDRTRTWTRVWKMTIKDLYYTFAGMKHCLRFHWRQISRARDNFEYIYCPRRGMVDFTRFRRKGK